MHCIPIIVAVSVGYLALWGAMAGVCIGSLLLLRTQWARRRPMWRCVLLSLAAHAILVGVAATIRFVGMPPGAEQDKPVRVTIVSMAPQPSIEAPDTPAATPEESLQPSDEPAVPEVVEAPSEEQVEEPTPAEEPLTPPDLMPEPVPQPEPTPQPVQEPQPSELAEQPVEKQPMPEASEPVETEPVVAQAPVQEPAMPQPTSTPTPPQPATEPLPPAVPASLAERIKPDRLQSVIEQGGSRETEHAVGKALEWLAIAQSDDGRWDASRWQAGREMYVLGHNREGAGGQADTAVTGLALLTFLGAGHTHLEGSYQHEVARGLVFLMRSQDNQGCLAGGAAKYARTYCHSMATFALAEAYALTKDKRLEPTVRRAVDYLLWAENKSVGGWRYVPHDRGDVSQLGWVIMALRSAELAGINVPDDTWARIESFLARVARGRHGGLAAYQVQSDWSRAMTAEAMYCRQVLGVPLKGAAQTEALNAIAAELPGDNLTNYYYWYYAALALHHAQNDGLAAQHTWNRWNQRMKRELLTAQVAEGANAGSWSPNTVWGGYGGRVYTTAMAAMCLEVYYRYGSPAGGNSPWIASRPRGETTQR
ncbi:hypothetical protein NG895_22310 [Aeoliella sp. ICT_H6.2]|uniref:Prenyltransferase/squalene oxidase-like repeat protein n=1 Tax=Aeoliella straminimaris TaxID=2954799 RepID=A0A9X2FH83_9BACT|nr:hypothetical protein [Aeoliella straminimaris]MCO6046639.1 hypothetical protein [Aeoliella straminimaris]